jgi:predicted NUDIX family phosphoesterase/dephospho-CoA kinase
MTSEFLSIAKQLMESEKRPMSPKELVNLAYTKNLFSDKIAGKTPHQTMKAKLSVHVRRYGEASVFVRVAPGRFYLRHLVKDPIGIYEAKRLEPSPLLERVLVFPSKWLDESDRFQGIKKEWRRLTSRLFKSGVCEYMARREAELNENYKQLLTYIMVTRNEKVLAYKRGQFTRAEQFLKGSHCIGFGGHVSSTDYNLFHENDYGLKQSAIRELLEEIRVPPVDHDRLVDGEGIEIVGLLNDDSSGNGRRHLAVLMRYTASSDQGWENPQGKEKSVTQVRWLDPAASPQSLWEFEYWSQLCLLEFYHGSQITKPTFLIRRKVPLRPPHILVVVGPVGSGKSEATKVLKTDFRYMEINSGRVLAGELGIPPVNESNRLYFQNRALEYVKESQGFRKLAVAVWKRATGKSLNRILVDGIRHRETLQELKNVAGDHRVGVLYVHTPFNVAFNFYRTRVIRKMDIHDFLVIRDNPVEAEVDGLITIADAILYNWRGRTAYRKVLREMMKEIGLDES